MTEGHFPHDFESEMKEMCLSYEYMTTYYLLRVKELFATFQAVGHQ